MEWKRLKLHSILPFILLGIIWLIALVEFISGESLSFLGVLPRQLSGLPGIIFMPFVHGGWNHLLSNSFPLFFLSLAVFYLHRDLGYKSMAIIWISAGALTWIIARSSYHIGASGVIYGLATYLFFSGILSKDYRLWAFSLLISFLYGSLVWGIFPFDPQVSHEGHAAGAISGLGTALLFRKQLPEREKYDWELENEDEDQEEVAGTWQNNEFGTIPVGSNETSSIIREKGEESVAGRVSQTKKENKEDSTVKYKISYHFKPRKNERI